MRVIRIVIFLLFTLSFTTSIPIPPPLNQEESSKQQQQQQQRPPLSSSQLPSIFHTQPPRDILHGLSLALSNVLRGTSIGILSLFLHPLAHYQKCGTPCLLTGILSGLLSFVLFPLSGCVIGFNQLCKGLQNTPAAIRNRREGKVWICERNEWRDYYLQEEYTELFRRQQRQRRPANRYYYDILGVPFHASTKEIKRAYHRKAREYHPDKTKNKTGDDDRFRVLSKAYETLSRPRSRTEYDERGKVVEDENRNNGNNSNHNQMDMFVFFNVLLDGNAVKQYVGELWIVTALQNILQEKFTLFERHKQTRREVEMGLYLRDRIEPFFDDVEEFGRRCHAEALEIKTSVYGDVFLKVIGDAMQLQAKEFLEYGRSFWGWRGYTLWMRKKTKSMTHGLVILGKSLKVLGVAWKAHRKLREEEDKQDDDKVSFQNSKQSGHPVQIQQFENSLPAVLEWLWAINSNDIARTVHQACFKLFSDASVSIEKRLMRAEAVLLLGTEFSAVASMKNTTTTTNRNVENIKRRAGVAFFKSMSKDKHDYSFEEIENLIKLSKDMSW